MPLPELTAVAEGDFDKEVDEWMPGTITDIHEDSGEYGPSIKWIFELDAEPGREEWAWTSQKTSPRSKVIQWMAGLGFGVEPGDIIPLADAIGMRCDVMYERRESGKVGIGKVRKSKTAAPKKTKVAAAAAVTNDFDAPF